MGTPDNVIGGAARSCWSCKAVIAAEDSYCRVCGKGQGSHVPWQYKHWGIIVITLFGLGPFSLFYLRRSPVISRNAKFGYTAVILLLTLFVLDRIYKAWVVFQALLGSLPVY